LSWYAYLSVLKDQQQTFNYYASIPPWACPECGEPLTPAPAGAENTIFCRFDGWEYPRDYIRPMGGVS